MTVRQQWGVVGLVVLLLATGLGAASYLMKDELFPVTIGSKAPDFQARALGTDTVRTLDDYRGKVVLLNIWATYCEPCKVEMPSLERLHHAYGDSGLQIVAVEIDPTVNDDSVRTYTRNLGITFQVLRDPTHSVEKAYQTTGYPETFIIGREGTIRRKWIGPDDWSSAGNRTFIAELLGLASPRMDSLAGDAPVAQPMGAR